MNARKTVSLLAIPLLLAASLQGADRIREGAVRLADEPGRLCGTPVIAGKEARLLENTRLLQPQLPATLAKPGGTAHEVGDTLSFYTIDFATSSYSSIKAVCKKKTSHSYIFVGTEDLDEGRVTVEDVDGFYTAFETATPPASLDPARGIYDLVTSIFGAPPDRFNEKAVYILIHDIKDSYNPDLGKRVYIAGYFSPTDQTTGSYSNRKNLINVDCYPQNPAGDGALATVAHEFQHLIHNGLDADEDTNGLWVDEGASEYSEVLCGYALRSPAYYLLHPQRSLTEFDASDENLWDYQKVALWTYYLAEKFGPELIGTIVRDPKNSIDGVRSALVTRGIPLSFEEIFTNFAVANYADNPDLGANGWYAYNKIVLPSLPASKPHAVYPLADQSASLPKWSMGYYRFTGEDSTAVLHLQGKPGFQMAAEIYESGSQDALHSVALDAANSGSYSLQAIGRSADALVLTAVSLKDNNSFIYSVSSELTDNTPPLILSGPREMLPTGHSMAIAWQTDEPAASLIEYGTTSSYGQRLRDTTLVTDHVATLTGLEPNTLYHYRVGATDAYGNGPRYSADFQFQTAAAFDQSLASVQQSHAYAYSGRNLTRTPDHRLHLLYHEVAGSRRFIYHKGSADDGTTWSDAIQVDATLFHGGMPSVAADALGGLHAAWHARPVSSSDKLGIYYSHSGDGGATWSAPVRLSDPDEDRDMLYAAIAVDPAGNPHVVWNSALYDDDYAGDVYHAHSSDGGLTWSPVQLLSSLSGSRRCHVPVIDFTPTGEAWVIWCDGVFDDATRNVWCTRSMNDAAWDAPSLLTTSGVLYDRYPALVIDEAGVVHLAYTDNYKPGDIRILYKYYQDGVWSTAEPAAKSATGNVSSPSLTCDGAGTVALLYRDDQGAAALGRYVAAPWQAADAPVLAKASAADGDIFLNIRNQGEWIAGGNISNDEVDDQYPETPRRSPAGSVDALWMRVNSATSNEIHFLHLATVARTSSKPLHVSAVYPVPGAVGISYFKQDFYVQADFDQRVISDSITAATFSVTSATRGPLIGLITYDPSIRRLRFQVDTLVPADDSITVRLKGTIPQEGGVGLDGNNNSIAEGSPVDDFVWGFRTAAPDQQPPALTIGIAQNPVLTRYMDIYIFSSETLAKTPAVEIGGAAVPAQRVPGNIPLYKADYQLAQNGILHIKVSGEDLAGNNGLGERDFSAQFMLAGSGGELASPDGRLTLALGPASVPQDLYMTIVPEEETNSLTKPSWAIGPADLVLNRPVQLRLALAAPAAGNPCFEQRQPDGSWRAIPTAAENGILRAALTRLGSIRLAAAAPSLPQHFALRQNYPNPFHINLEKTTFLLDLPEAQEVEISLFNLLGERICTLHRGRLEAGEHVLVWDGLDESRRVVASGVYFYRCSTPARTLTRKLLILQ
ncbi:MAG TPA: fibronectin type III domain-containing protein [bacterium]|nr:fibronectin type III domain-containing protein [bacterium]HQI49369.1 fibronectin type III domain-containing protein [bacterium]HQJ64870.1 fibronectin type III domain-containing protein [bacterium]